MRILHLYKYYYPFLGGIENHLRLLASEQARTHQVQALVCNTGWHSAEEWVGPVRVVRCGRWMDKFSTPFAPRYPLALHRLGRAADRVHIHLADPPAVFYFPLLFPHREKTLVVTYHMEAHSNHPSLSLVYRFFLDRLLPLARRIIVGSPGLRSSPVLQPYRHRCEVIPYGIDPRRFRETSAVRQQAQRIRQQFGSPLVLFVGRLVYYKGLPTLLEAAAQIRARVLIIGTGPEEPILRQRAAQLRLDEKVTFLGSVSEAELPAYYHACDVFTLPSTGSAEAFGLVQLEAMVCGKPVVSTNLPEVSFVNRHGETGLIVPPQDAVRLAEALNQLLEDPGLRANWGRNGRERVRTCFSKEQMVQRTLALYD